jgi:hypothetical protein
MCLLRVHSHSWPIPNGRNSNRQVHLVKLSGRLIFRKVGMGSDYLWFSNIWECKKVPIWAFLLRPLSRWCPWSLPAACWHETLNGEKYAFKPGHGTARCYLNAPIDLWNDAFGRVNVRGRNQQKWALNQKEETERERGCHVASDLDAQWTEFDMGYYGIIGF